MNQSVSFKVNLTLKEYRDFSYAFLLTGMRGVLYISILAMFLAVAAGMVIINIAAKRGFTYHHIIFGLTTLFLFILPVRIWFSSRKMYETDRFLSEEQNYTVSEKGLNVAAQSVKFSAGWPDIKSVREVGSCIAVFIGQNKAFIIPKKSLENQMDDFKSIVNAQMPPKKVKIR